MFQSWWPPSDSYLKTYKRLFWFEHIPTSSCSWGWCYCRGPLFWWFIFSDGCSRWILVKICQTSFLHIIFSLSLSLLYFYSLLFIDVIMLSLSLFPVLILVITIVRSSSWQPASWLEYYSISFFYYYLPMSILFTRTKLIFTF